MNEKEKGKMLKRIIAESTQHYKDLANQMERELGIALSGDEIEEVIEWLQQKGEI